MHSSKAIEISVNNKVESIELKTIISQIIDAAKKGEFSVTIPYVITEIMSDALKILGYAVRYQWVPFSSTVTNIYWDRTE